jgi:PEP-CTERM motif
MVLGTARLTSLAILACAAMAPGAAQAGLLGAGRTVQAMYFNGQLAGPELEINAAIGTADPAELSAPVNYLQGALSGSTITVDDTTITITNMLSGAPFCLSGAVGSACTDSIDGFGFQFTGEDILGVSVDPSSSPDFLPVAGTFQGHTHLGLQLIDNNLIRVDVTGETPALSSKLTIDLVFAPVPEPATAALMLFGSAFVGWAATRRRRSSAREGRIPPAPSPDCRVES